MPKHLLDAVETATDIHNGNYSSLRGKYFVIRDKIKKKKDYHSGDNTVKKSRIDRLEERMDRLEDRFDRLEELIANLAKQMNARFDNLEKRIDNIDARLDYIVSANNLKDLPKAKSK